jgi:hypothetical protein
MPKSTAVLPDFSLEVGTPGTERKSSDFDAYAFVPNSPVSIVSEPSTITDGNISTKKIIFQIVDLCTFGTWSTNGTNVADQNNAYIGGVNENTAFEVTNVVVHQIDMAHGNSNGTSDIVIEDKSQFAHGSKGSGWSVLRDATTNDSSTNPWNTLNDAGADHHSWPNYANLRSASIHLSSPNSPANETHLLTQGIFTNGLGVSNTTISRPGELQYNSIIPTAAVSRLVQSPTQTLRIMSAEATAGSKTSGGLQNDISSFNLQNSLNSTLSANTVTNDALLPVYTIEVGTPGTYTNDSNVNVSTLINAELAKAPAGYRINLVFNPGTYGVSSTILLPSNTSVTGNDSALVYLDQIPSAYNFALMANKDSYCLGEQYTTTNQDGSQTLVDFAPNSSVSMAPGSNTVIDSNISVTGMTFQISGGWVFGTWFTNATNIDVQNNTYIGGVDGNAFVDVVNGLVAQNVAVGQLNASYDNWNGPTNITIEDNTSFGGGSSTSGWSVLLNSTPSGNPANPGNGTNDGVIDNQFSSNYSNSKSVSIRPLSTNGYTTESYMTQQGNTTSGLGVADTGITYSGGPQNNVVIQDEVFSGLVQSPTQQFSVISSEAISGSEISGNLIDGLFSVNEIAPISSTGTAYAVTNNQVLGNSAQNDPNNFGDLTAPSMDIQAPTTLWDPSPSPILVPNLQVEDTNGAAVVSVTLTTQFGIVSLAGGNADEQYTTANGETSLIISGSLQQINQDLQNIYYSSNSLGWDDSLEIYSTDSSGSYAVRYIPILVGSGASPTSDVVTVSGTIIANTSPDLSSISGAGLPAAPSLTGSVIMVSTGDNYIEMGSTASLALLGTGNDTVQGGSLQEYIATGSGNALINLTNSGDVTVAGGAGHMTVNAYTGDDLVEVGVSSATVKGGSGSISVLGGLGTLVFNGSSGPQYIATLPQDAGSMVLSLGTGNSTVYALSGIDQISSQANTSNVVYFGLGIDILDSSGADLIYGGSGNATINATYGGSDTIFGGSGSLTFLAGSASNFLDPATSSSISTGSGNLAVGLGGSFVLSISEITGSTNTVTLPSLSDGVELIGFGPQPIESEILSNGILTLALTDGTTIDLSDLNGYAIQDTSGALSFSTGIMPDSVLMINVSAIPGITTDNSINLMSALDETLANVAAGTQADLVFSEGTYYLEGSLMVGASSMQGGLSPAILLQDGVYFFDSGPGQSVVAASDDLVAVGDGSSQGDWTITNTSLGSDSITSVSEYTTISIGGAGNVVGLAGSFATVYGSSSNEFVASYAGDSEISIDGSGNVLVSGGSATVYAAPGSSSVTSFFFGIHGGQLDFINQSESPASVTGGFQGAPGSVTVDGGLAGGYFQGGLGGNNSLVGGIGNESTTLVGAGDNNFLFAQGSGANALFSGDGSATLIASAATTNNLFQGGYGTDLMSSSGSGIQSFFVGTEGSETITGATDSSAQNNYYFIQDPSQGGGTDVLMNFRYGIDQLLINPSSPGDVVIASINDIVLNGQSSSIVSLTDNTTIKLIGTSFSSTQISNLVGHYSL